MSLRKACRALKGAAGYKRLKIMEAAKCDEKRIESKVQYMTGSKARHHPPAKKPARTLVVPEAASMSASDSSDFQV